MNDTPWENHLDRPYASTPEPDRPAEVTAASTASPPRRRRGSGRVMLNKVPEVTLYFWIIKILCTTVGETAADYLNVTLGFGLTATSQIMAALLTVLLVAQFRVGRYVPWIYWLAIVWISVMGTLITDNLTDNLGVPLAVTTVAFAVVLTAIFALWFACERTLSIHSIVTRRREAFYWLTILFTFALGTAAGDLVAERLKLGYPLSVVLFGAMIAVTAAAHYTLRLDAVAAFWIAYVLTRPLGASIGDLLSQPPDKGGLGMGATTLNALFLLAIVGLISYLTISRVDRIPPADSPAPPRGPRGAR